MAKSSSEKGKGAGKLAPISNTNMPTTNEQELVFSLAHYAMDRLQVIFPGADPNAIGQLMVEMGDVSEIEIRDFLGKNPQIKERVGLGAYGLCASIQYILIASRDACEGLIFEANACVTEAMFWAGFAMGTVETEGVSHRLMQERFEKIAAITTSQRMRDAALARNKSDPARVAMAQIKDDWLKMQSNLTDFMKDAPFARKMASQFPDVTEGAIRNAITRWRKELKSSS